ncbi:hypothetical protein SNE40_010802 [Patella caerulea]|uniref:D-aminoacyl-tRNA deacylase n=1 Tax=Patella caerulea TaxID=87958 RepID=A0AAN8Q0N9_PATCE
MAVETMPKARVVLQQCLSAKLQIQPETDETPAKHVEINRGLVVYVCFLNDATEDILDKMVKNVLMTRLSEGGDRKLVSILDLPGDVLIIPQATLGGILKGKMMQYHKNIDKETGLKLYTNFVEMCEQSLTENSKNKGVDVCVKSGTYGNRQVFSCTTNGPYTHIIEF